MLLTFNFSQSWTPQLLSDQEIIKFENVKEPEKYIDISQTLLLDKSKKQKIIRPIEHTSNIALGKIIFFKKKISKNDFSICL